MKILMLVNWKVEYSESVPDGKQPPDYYVKGIPYWFFRYFDKQPEVDVVDIKSFKWLENFEQKKLRFYIWQTVKILPKIRKYDLIISHGMQSGVVLSLWRRLFRTRAKHIVFDIGAINSAAESGLALKLMQFASKSIDGFIYHTSSQIEYYKEFFPWIVEKSRFIRFGADMNYFTPSEVKNKDKVKQYIICVGHNKRDWNTLIKAFKEVDTNLVLRLVGHVDKEYNNIKNVEQYSYIPINELIDQIRGAALCVLPLEYFNYSFGQMTLMQQMALGKCVIAARVPSLMDYVVDMQTAVLYESGNAIDLKNKIEYLLANDEITKAIGKRARQYLIKECNEKTMAFDIQKAIDDLLK